MSVERRCICGRRVFGKSYEDLGEQPMHACCRIWIANHDRERCKAMRRRGHQCAACRGECPACLSSDAARAEFKRREEDRAKERAKQARIEARAQAKKVQAEKRRARRRKPAGPPPPRRTPATPAVPATPPPPRRRFADAVATAKEIER